MPTVAEGIYMITANDVNEGRIKFESARKTTEAAFKYLLSDKSKPRKNDILLTKDGSLGRLALVGNEKICINQSVAVIRPNDKVYSLFLKLLLEDTYYQRTMIENAGGSAIKHIYITIVNKMKVGIPASKAEQTAIATALSDADALISSLEKLIVKKRNIKQGAMQKLLEPKEGWEVKKLGEIFDFKQGVQCAIENQSLAKKDGQKRFIRIVDLTQENELPRFIDDPGISHHIKNDDLFMVRYGNPGLLGFGFEGVIANNLFRLNLKYKYSTTFFYHLLGFKNDAIMQLTSSTTMAALNFTALRELMIAFPKSKEEQTRIATILSDMDAEISALETKLEKYRKVKLGMMQNLLTGKIRLV